MARREWDWQTIRYTWVFIRLSLFYKIRLTSGTTLAISN